MIKDLLAGQILWVGWGQIGVVAAVYAIVLVAWFAFRDRFGRSGFYVIFAVAVTASVQLVGVYLVFASLIMPALAARKNRRGGPLIAGYFVGAVGLAAGLASSALFDLSTGPAVVTTMAVSALAAARLR